LGKVQKPFADFFGGCQQRHVFGLLSFQLGFLNLRKADDVVDELDEALCFALDGDGVFFDVLGSLISRRRSFRKIR
jgi:hypothetical protein